MIICNMKIHNARMQKHKKEHKEDAPTHPDRIPLKQLPADVFFRARSTLNNLSEALIKPRVSNTTGDGNAKSKRNRQTTLDYFLSPRKTTVEAKIKNQPSVPIAQPQKKPLENRHKIFNDDMAIKTKPTPIQNGNFQRQIPAVPTLPNLLEKANLEGPFAKVSVIDCESPDTPILGRPRKKLSFREPEIIGSARVKHETLPRRITSREDGPSGTMRKRCNSLDNLDTELESQALLIVRSVGKAFEVGHKTSPSTTPWDTKDSEQPSNREDTPSSVDTTDDHQDGKDNHLASPTTNNIHGKNDKENARDAREDSIVSPDDPATSLPITRPNKLEFPPPPLTITRCSPSKFLVGADSASTPIPVTPTVQFATQPSCSPTQQPCKQPNPVLTAAGAVAAHHELQLLKERLEQQSQQTCHAVSQLLLLRDQLAAETAARVEAQGRTQQLLVHNRELLDHITALVTHLQISERAAPQVTNPGFVVDNSTMDSLTPTMDNHLNHIGNVPPNSPIRFSSSPNQGNAFSFNFPQDNLLAQRFQPYGFASTPEQMYPYVYLHQNTSLVNNYNNLRTQPLNIKTLPELSVSNATRCEQPSPSGSEFSVDDAFFIRPLSQVGTLTTTDSDGKLRVIVPVNENANNKDKKIATSGLKASSSPNATLKVTGEKGYNMTRSASERVHRESVGQKGNWARNSTK